jgi:uncharacterized protein
LKKSESVWGTGGRVELLDSVRGFALMGLFLVHCVEQYELFWSHPDYGPVYQWVFGLFSGKSYILMALCFGVSFFLIMEGAARRGQDFRARFAWRLAILIVMGLLHGLLYRGDFLQNIGVVGLAMLAFDRIKSNKVLVWLAVLCLLQIPLLLRAWAASQGFAWGLADPLYFNDTGAAAMASGTFPELVRANAFSGFIMRWSFFIESGRMMQMFGLFIVGLILGRIGFFAKPDSFKALRRWALAISALLWAVLYFWAPGVIAAGVAEGPVRNNIQWAVDAWTGVALMTVEMLAFIELFLSAAGPLARVFAAPGRMTLTLYVGESIVFTPIFYGYGLGIYDDLSTLQWLEIGIVAFAAQIVFAHLWFRRFHYGPLEWIWRAATRTSWNVPFVKAPVAATA